eukprot:CAMPEP_0174926772 /NCGR_PEP_ID=MMETSP1355-20121228/14526_1 /TAXON_ID=464990 /ORGANISM="Hemiselmis tepida, Strain CCMP443" /LENGTH=66 /DNA_ID=CAMNT_0016172833 /DNA_START=8 /DNA_END=208 /DNA_ORIENTATION=+
MTFATVKQAYEQSLSCYCRDQWNAPDGKDAKEEGKSFKYYPLVDQCGGVNCAYDPSSGPSVMPASD